MRKSIHSWLILMALSLVACQAPAPLQAPPEALPALLTSHPQPDTVHLKIQIASREDFRIQGVKAQDIAYFKAKVIGPGLKDALWNRGGARRLEGDSLDMEIPNIPKGKNRIVKAMAYDSFDHHLFDLAGHYSSSEAGNKVVVTLQRRFDPLARLMETWLKQADRETIHTLSLLNLDNLQTVLEDGLLFTAPPKNELEQNTFAVDPTAVRADELLKIVKGLNGQSLTPETLRSNKEHLVQGKQAISFVVGPNGQPLANVKVTLSTPTAPDLTTDSEGKVNFNGLPEGEWRIVGSFPDSEALDGDPRSFGKVLVSHQSVDSQHGSQKNPLVKPAMIVTGVRLESDGDKQIVYIEGKGFKPHHNVMIDSQRVEAVFSGEHRIAVRLPAGTVKLGTSHVKLVNENQESNIVFFKSLALVDKAETEDGAGDTRNVTATQKALDYLAVDGVNWDKANNCYGCHVQSEAARALAIGVQTKYQVILTPSVGDGGANTALNNQGLRQLMDRMLRAQNDSAGYVDHGGSYHRTNTMHAAPAFAAYSAGVDATYDAALLKMADWTVGVQAGDGSWSNDHITFPFTVGGENIQPTANNLMLVRRALQLNNKPSYQTAMTRGIAYLRSQKGSLGADTQKITHFILGLRQGGLLPTSDPDLIFAMEQLDARRVDMGGTPKKYAWMYYTGYGTVTPYATGMALTAIKAMDVNWYFEPTRGLHRSWVDSYRGAYEWLITSQRADGAWTGPGTGSNFAQTMWPALGLASASAEALDLEILEPRAGHSLKGKIPIVFKLTEKLLPPSSLQRIEIQINGAVVKAIAPGDQEWDSVSPSEAVVRWIWDAGRGTLTNVDLKIRFVVF